MTSAKRTRKYCERIKNNSSKFKKMTENQKEHMRYYRERVKQERQNNTKLDEELKAKQ